jgi:hypothetical protein
MAAAAASAIQPVVVNLIAPSGASALQWVQVVGTIVVAVIAAGIAGSVQYRQMQIAKGALKTADNKLRLDLYERRFAIVDAAMALMTDRYRRDNDDSVDGDYNRFHELLAKIGFASWLFDQKVDMFVSMIAGEANERYDDHPAFMARQRKLYEEKGFHLSEEVIANRQHAEQMARKLEEMVRPYMTIHH